MLSQSRESSPPTVRATMTPPQEADDATLVHKLIDEHPHAARLIWQRFAPMVYGILRRALGPDDAVEDLAQEVFLCVFQKASTLREARALRAFVMTVTAFTASRERRRRWRRAGQGGQRLLTAPDQLVAAQHIESREALRRFLLIVDRINVRDRTAFDLHFIEGMPIRSVASALDVSLATAKRRVSRAWSRVLLHAAGDTALVEYLSCSRRETA